ncbi:hypothetical protein [Noviherbaspirillum galbum]|uniref:Uncharacterized protein n=1 Tax=Noviherbaspirillum galbum TaxID=2709383 RepID=A0A6B3SVZ1_9BURK|nr:hypothetical protein [Noviherbaspirillum galbum]NEX62552.1 hypothetical protein [Noviherbaspirillum galbum]
MNSLDSAKKAIKAELAQARQGAEYYLSLASALEDALEKLESARPAMKASRTAKNVMLNGKSARRAAPGRKTGTGRSAKAGTAAGKSGKAPAGTSALPKTGMAFWIDLLSEEPKSAGDILKAAMDRLGLANPDSEQKKKLIQRQTFALNTLVKDKKIADEGTRRARRFFVRNGEQSRQ